MREEAIPEITKLVAGTDGRPRSRSSIEAEKYLPGDPEVERVVAAASRVGSIHSTPEGALVEVKDYNTPAKPWIKLGTTPIENKRVPNGYLRWRLSDASDRELFVAAPITFGDVSFDLERVARAPKGMVPVQGGPWGDLAGYYGTLRFVLPPFFIDRFEVTNREYQEFVDKGGYETPAYWKHPFVRDGREVPWKKRWRCSATRPAGPALDLGRRSLSRGQRRLSVAGVSWFEAAAYAEYAARACRLSRSSR